ncbi:RNA polymerase sigma factor [Sphingomonas sp.]|uniref:RNA polymerase sigma factor n=1 Tax=Sphingomonas sp. TaxID=28214 RepID=UPI001ECC00C1|nr:RNA polymerase sigma factor [Sphingomonas sp.]MBX3594571.1 RNA polymerase sigma factor [Sphingomonas sp.]
MAREASRLLDEYLVVSAQAGDRRAFAQLVARWHKRLIVHAWRLTGDPDSARDAAQTGWSEIVRGLARLNDARAFPAWAYRIVSRVCAKQARRERGRRLLAEAIGAEPAPEPIGPDAGVEHDRLRAAIRALPPDQRAAIALYHFEELSVAEVAVALDVSAGTVKTRLMHARRKLRAALEGEETCGISTR